MSRSKPKPNQLTAAETANVQKGFKKLWDDGWTQKRLEKEIGISQQSISAAIRKPSPWVAIRVATLLGVTVNRLLDEGETSPASPADGVMAKTLPGWSEIVQKAREHINLPNWCWEAIGQFIVPRPPELTIAYVWHLAEAVWHGAPESHRNAMEKRELEGKLTKESKGTDKDVLERFDSDARVKSRNSVQPRGKGPSKK